jgi:hypothetical protein
VSPDGYRGGSVNAELKRFHSNILFHAKTPKDKEHSAIASLRTQEIISRQVKNYLK